ncbi:MAG: helix-turn-helix transcriptional regulator [Bacteroidales bacterium]|nr:helix-turn-helix transcriptional regulator [Bacteroidales bacterium]
MVKEQSSEKKTEVKPYIYQDMVPAAHLELREESVSEEMNSIALRFIDYFEREKPYLNPDLRIVDVAEHLFTNKTYLSRAINIKFGKNFSQLVHWFRIRDAVDIYANDKSKSMTMQELHQRVGFRSMSTFNTAFSRYTGKTPAEWCRHYDKVEKNA